MIARAAAAATGSTYQLPRGVVVTVDSDAVIVSRGPLEATVIPEGFAAPLPFAGVAGGWRISVQPVASGLLLPARAVVRGRRPGDRMRPRGFGGSRKLQDVYVDRKVPRRLRDSAPVVALGGDVFWTPFAAAAPYDGGTAYAIEACTVGDVGEGASS
jgi:tRNA(Ile)-lysidine synthetase-like protein